MNWLGKLNFYVLQWFGLRLYRFVAEDRHEPTLWWGVYFVAPRSGYDGRPFRFWGPDRTRTSVRR